MIEIYLFFKPMTVHPWEGHRALPNSSYNCLFQFFNMRLKHESSQIHQSPAKWLCHPVVTGSRYCCYAPLVLCCDQFDRGSRQVKRDPVNLVTGDYDNTSLANSRAELH